MKLTSFRASLFKDETEPSKISICFEMILFTMLPICAGVFFKPKDPFFLNGEGSILMAPPLLLALRYGLIPGLTSLVIITLLLVGGWILKFGNITIFPSKMLFGVLFFTLLVGGKTDNSRANILKYKARNKFLALRFGEFTDTYHMMKVSYDQLNEALANTRSSLRGAFQVVREKMQQRRLHNNEGLTPDISSDLLSIFSYFCFIEIAGVYSVDRSEEKVIKPIALHGDMPPLRLDDQLLLQALEKNEMISVKAEMYTADYMDTFSTDLLAVIPIKDISGNLWGIVAVAEMQFTAFQQENLNIMRLIGAYTGDLLSQAENIFYAKDGKKKFFDELDSSWRMAQEYGIFSSLISISFKNAHPDNAFISAITGRIRGIDHVWISDENPRRSLIIFLLMPLMTEREFILYQQSLNCSLKEKFNYTVEESGGVIDYFAINDRRQLFECLSFIDDKTDGTLTPALVSSEREQKTIVEDIIKPNVN